MKWFLSEAELALKVAENDADIEMRQGSWLAVNVLPMTFFSNS